MAVNFKEERIGLPSHSQGYPLVCGLAAENSSCPRTPGRARHPRRSLHHELVGDQIQP